MKHVKFLGAAGVLLAVLAPTMASAQDVQKPVTLKLGAFFPSNGDVKRAVGNTWFSAGLEYAFQKPAATSTGPLNSVQPLVYLDYTGKTKKVDGVNLEGRTINVGVGIKYYAPTEGAVTTRPYIGAGIGAAVVHAKSSETTTDGEVTTTSSVSKDQTNFGFKINGGVEFAQNYLVDVAYWNSGKVEGTRLDGYGVSLGYKF